MTDEKRVELTIIIPAYNVAQYLDKCLGSMVAVDKRLEIIIVDDGSVDQTAEIADRYAALYPEQVRVIHKENGGHGSGINVGVAYARGRYFKVIDADDWIVTENLEKILDRLAESDADAVVAGFHEVDMTTGRKAAYSSICEWAGQEVGVEQLLAVYDAIRDCFSFHGLFYKTEWYRAAGICLTEGVFYEDQEYAAYPFAYLRTLLVAPEYFYQYMVGNSDQSVSYQNQVKRIGHIETVLKNMVAFYWEHAPMEKIHGEYYMRRLTIVATSYFATALVKNRKRKEGRSDAERMHLWLVKEMPELLGRIEKKYKVLQLAGMLRLSPELYQKLLTTGIYQMFRNLWVR